MSGKDAPPRVRRRSPSGTFIADSETDDIRKVLRDLAERAVGIRVGDYEAFEAPAEVIPLLDAVEALLTSSIAAFGQLTSELDLVVESSAAARPDGAVASAAPTKSRFRDPEQVSSVCFLGRYVLAETRTELGRVRARLGTEPDPELGWEAIEIAHAAVREIVKAVSGVDLALCAASRQTTGLPYFASAVRDALDTRHAIVSLRRGVEASAPPAARELRSRLRRIAAAIVKLQGRRSYGLMRVGDRRALRAIHARVVDWLRLHRDDGDHVEGLRLWQECVNLAEIAMSVNKRQELRAYDHFMLQRLRSELDAGRAVAQVVEIAGAVRGRDEELDALLGDPAAGTEALRATIDRVLSAVDVDPAMQERHASVLAAIPIDDLRVSGAARRSRPGR